MDNLCSFWSDEKSHAPMDDRSNRIHHFKREQTLINQHQYQHQLNVQQTFWIGQIDRTREVQHRSSPGNKIGLWIARKHVLICQLYKAYV